jgi:hypothetical protein
LPFSVFSRLLQGKERHPKELSLRGAFFATKQSQTGQHKDCFSPKNGLRNDICAVFFSVRRAFERCGVTRNDKIIKVSSDKKIEMTLRMEGKHNPLPTSPILKSKNGGDKC